MGAQRFDWVQSEGLVWTVQARPVERPVPHFLIRNIDGATIELLTRRAARLGKTLEDDLRETLEQLARAGAASPDDTTPFGDWLVAISRPGADLIDPWAP